VKCGKKIFSDEGQMQLGKRVSYSEPASDRFDDDNDATLGGVGLYVIVDVLKYETHLSFLA